VSSRRSRSKPAVRVIRVRAIGRGVSIRRVRIRIRSGCAYYGTRRHPGRDATPTIATIATAVPATTDVYISIEIRAVEVTAIKVPAVEIASTDSCSIETASGEPATACETTTGMACETTTGPACETTTAGPPGKATAATAETATAATAETTTAATAETAPAATAPAHQHERRICPLRRRGGDIAGHAAAPGSLGGGGLSNHQPDQSDRRHAEQTLSWLLHHLLPSIRVAIRPFGVPPVAGIEGDCVYEQEQCAILFRQKFERRDTAVIAIPSASTRSPYNGFWQFGEFRSIPWKIDLPVCLSCSLSFLLARSTVELYRLGFPILPNFCRN
jgi:hypothetical protein